MSEVERNGIPVNSLYMGPIFGMGEKATRSLVFSAFTKTNRKKVRTIRVRVTPVKCSTLPPSDPKFDESVMCITPDE